MKILFLNPHIDAQHKIVQALRTRGMALLMPSNADEAWQVLKLHGTSVDLAIIHREGLKGGDPGVELLYNIKRDPVQSDLAVVFTTETWSPEQCANHQQTSMGANAYLCWPFDETELLNTVDAVFQPEAAPIAAEETPESVSAPSLEPPSSGEFVLEDPSRFLPNEGGETGKGSIQLESPAGVQGLSLDEVSNSGVIEKGAGPDDPIEIAISSDAQGSSIPASKPPVPATDELSLKIELADGENPAGGDSGSELPESDLEKEMPYLFSSPEKSGSVRLDSAMFSRAFAQPVGDAVVPGGAAQSPDTETLKKYLLLREQDVAALSAQLKAARDEMDAMKAQLKDERRRTEELQFTVQEQKRKIEDFEREKELALEGLQAELQELRFQTKAKTDKARLLEGQVREASADIERLKERVRSDIRKIRVRERELENKLEIAKKDSEAVLTARENKIIELKRKLDLLEFNMDLLQDRYTREREGSAKLREKLSKAAQVVRVAEGLLDEPGAQGTPPDETKAS